MGWEFLVGQYRLDDRCVRYLNCIQFVQLEPLASDFTIFGVFGCVCFVASVLLLCLDEDCNPGWGDCGRPLRRCLFVLLKMVNCVYILFIGDWTIRSHSVDPQSFGH